MRGTHGNTIQCNNNGNSNNGNNNSKNNDNNVEVLTDLYSNPTLTKPLYCIYFLI